ncbi:MAG: tetratricopeptide repeat protein, partial [Acidobacteria bacterium]|nr:tetratricopeptide repeat protein [Acidobacteriota bacterium]
MGNLRFHQGDFDGARRYWQRLVSSAGEIRNNRDVVTGLMNIGVSYSREGRLSETIKYYEQALSQQWPALWEQAQVKSNLATIYLEYGIDPGRGLTLAREALQTFEHAGDRPWSAQARITLSIYYTNAGQYAAALDEIQQAQAIWRSVGNKERLALAIFSSGRVHFVHNQYEEAQKALAEALALAEETQDSFRKADSQIFLGLTYQRLGDSARAKALLEEGFRSIQKNDFGEMLPQAHAALGQLYWQSGEQERARASFQQAARLARDPAIPELSVEARADLGLLEAEQRDLRQGLAHCREAVAQARRLQSLHILARALINLARVHQLRQEYEPALHAVDEVIAMKNLGLEYRAQAYYARG